MLLFQIFKTDSHKDKFIEETINEYIESLIEQWTDLTEQYIE